MPAPALVALSAQGRGFAAGNHRGSASIGEIDMERINHAAPLRQQCLQLVDPPAGVLALRLKLARRVFGPLSLGK